MIDVVTIGESMVLIQPITDTSIQHSPLLTKTMGGAESNVAIGLARLGKKTKWISKVGDDTFGRYVLATIAGERVDISDCITLDNYPTAVYFKDFHSTQEPSIYYYRKGSAASTLSPDDIQSSWLKNVRHLHVTGITAALGEEPAKMIKEVMIQAKQLGLTISFDPNIRKKLWSEEQARKSLIELIPFCDIFLPGIDECELLFGVKTINEYKDILLELGPKLIFIKLGEKGSYTITKDFIFKRDAFKVERSVDTVGAGDAFAAGCLSVLLDLPHLRVGLNNPLNIKSAIEKASIRGNRLGSIAVQFKGDWEGLPTIKGLTALEQRKSQILR